MSLVGRTACVARSGWGELGLGEGGVWLQLFFARCRLERRGVCMLSEREAGSTARACEQNIKHRVLFLNFISGVRLLAQWAAEKYHALGVLR
jgi:hypothetical protein